MRFPNPFTRPFLGPTFHMNEEDDTGSGGADSDVDTDVEAPDDTAAAQAAAATAAANNLPAGSAPPPAAPPAASGGGDQYGAQIQQLLAMNAHLTQQLTARNAPPPDADDAPLDPDVERAIQKRLTKAQAPLQRQIQQMQDAQDQMEFTREVVENGYEQPLVDAAKQIFVAWRQNGIPATRRDALYFAVGQQDNATRKTKRAMPGVPAVPPAPKPNVHAVTERSGAGARPGAPAPKAAAVVETPRNKKERAAWIAATEAKLEKQGGF